MSFTNEQYQDIINSAKTELDKWNNAPEDFKKRSIELGFDLGNWYTNMIKACEQSMEPEKSASSPEQIQDLEKEMGTEGKENKPTEAGDWGGEQMADLKNLLGGMKEGPDSRFKDDDVGPLW